jgi:hypothetical protein
VCLGRLAGTLVIVVVGFRFGWRAPAEAVHEPAVRQCLPCLISYMRRPVGAGVCRY